MTRVVLNTNTLISGIFWPGTPRLVYLAATQERFQILTSDCLFTELNSVLRRPKFTPVLNALAKTAEDLIIELRGMVEFVSAVEIPAGIVRDPKDAMVLACAIGGKADFIVSGDKDLLTLTAYENIPILNAAQFLQRLADDQSA